MNLGFRSTMKEIYYNTKWQFGLQNNPEDLGLIIEKLMQKFMVYLIYADHVWFNKNIFGSTQYTVDRCFQE